jgi:NADH-quinone oxidoreductase subunit C
MRQSTLDLQNITKKHFGDLLLKSEIAYDELTIEVAPTNSLTILKDLRDNLNFEQLIDLTAIDYLNYGQANWTSFDASNSGFSRGVFDFEETEITTEDTESRFAVVYHLLSIKQNLRLRVKVYLDVAEMPQINSVIDVWSCANWYEREAFDMFGIIFRGHPDLRRLLTDYGFVGHPLRKDFPLEGHVEMRYDIEKKRVIYEPVSIKNRVNVPKVIRANKV